MEPGTGDQAEEWRKEEMVVVEEGIKEVHFG